MCQSGTGTGEHTSNPAQENTSGMGRRALLMADWVLGAAGALPLAPVGFAEADENTATGTPADGTEVTRTVTGHLETGAADFVYLPVEVPRGVNQIAVSYTYDKPSVPSGTDGNSCDIGIFDERGLALGGKGFRGWSGAPAPPSSSTATPRRRVTCPVPWATVPGTSSSARTRWPPQGMNYSVTITLRYGPAVAPFRPNYPSERAKGRGRAWYRGDCHLHTVHSDGRRLPSEVAAGARAAGLDFIVSTDHNTSSAHAVLGEYAGPDLLIINGEEVTTRNGHWLALGLDNGSWIDWRYRSRDDAFPRFARQVRRQGGLVVPAHPYCPYVACQWKFGYEDADAVEVWNGPWTYDDESAVDTWDAMLGTAMRSGKDWLPAMANSDAHSLPQVIGLPQTVVYADDLNRSSILEGIRKGRTYVAESSAVTFAAYVITTRRYRPQGRNMCALPSRGTGIGAHVTPEGVSLSPPDGRIPS